MKKKNLFLALGALALLLTSCTSSESSSTTPDSSTNNSSVQTGTVTDSSTTTSSDSSSADDSSVTDSSSSPDQDSSSSPETPTTNNNYGVTILTSRYGYATVDADIAKAGETINISVTCTAEDGVLSAGVKVNGVEHLGLNGDGIIQVEMEEGGLLVEPLFKSVLTEEVTFASSDVKVVVTEVENGEYRIDGGQWQDSNTFTGLSENEDHTVEVRIKAHDDLYASDAVSLDVTTKSENSVLSNILYQLQDGIAFKGTYTVARWWGGSFYDETIFDQELYVSSDQYFLDSCFADDGTEKNHVDYRRGSDGNAYSAVLNYSNEVVLTDTGTDFYDNYYNPFEDVTESDFERVDDDRFLLNIKEDTLSQYFTLYFTRYSAPVDYLYINVDAAGDVSGIDLYSTHTGTMNGSTTEYYEHVSLETVSYDEISAVQPITASFDTSSLDWVLKSLQNHNYTANIEITHNWYSNVNATYEAFGNGVIITEEGGYPYGYLETDNGLTLFDVNVGSDGTATLKGRNGYPIEGQTLDDVLPAFDISADLFSIYGSSTYTLRDIYSLYDYAYRLAADAIIDDYYIDYIVDGSLDITINTDSVVISYDWYDIYSFQGTATTTITNIGITQASYDLSTYEDFSSSAITKWSEFNTGFYDALATKFDIDPDEVIPFYYDEDHPWGDWYESNLSTIYLPVAEYFSSKADMAEFGNTYGDMLIEAGFNCTTSREDDGFGRYVKDNINLTISTNTYYNSLQLMFFL